MWRIKIRHPVHGPIVSGLFLAASVFIVHAVFLGNACLNPVLAANPQSELSYQSAGATIQQVTVRKGDTLFKILEYTGAARRNAAEATKAIKKIFNPKTLRVGQRIVIKLESAGNGGPLLSGFSVQLSKNNFAHVVRGSDGKFRADHGNLPWPQNLTSLADDGQLVESKIVSVHAKRGQTIGKIMRSLNIRERDIDRSVKAIKTRFDPRQLKVGQKISILPGELRDNGKLSLIGVAIHLKNGQVVNVRRVSDGVFNARRNAGLALGVDWSGKVTQVRSATAAAGEPIVNGAVQKERVPKGAILMDLLTARGISRAEADKAIRVLRAYFDPRRLRAGQTLHMVFTKNSEGMPELKGFSLAIDSKRHVTVTRHASGKFAGSLANGPLQSFDDIDTAERPPPSTSIAKQPAGQIVLKAKPAAPAPEKPLQSNLQKLPGKNATVEISKALEAPAKDFEPIVVSEINATTIKVNHGDTLMAILRSEGIDRLEADRAIRALRKKFNPRRLRGGQNLVLATRADKAGNLTLEGLSIELARERHIEVLRSGAKKFAVAKVDKPNFTKNFTVSEVNQRNSLRAMTQEDVKPASRPRPGQGQVMGGAIIAASAATERPLDADHARVWPVKFSAVDAINVPKLPTATNDNVTADGLTRKAVTIGKGDTLFVALTKAGSAATDAESAIAAFRTVHNPRNLQIGQTLTLGFEPLVGEIKPGALKLAEIILDVAPDRDIIVARQQDDSFHASEMARKLLRRLEKIEGHIQTSLYNAAMDAGLSISILMELVQIFSFDVDFQREIQKGDRFEVLYENLLNDDGESVALGPVIFASLSLSSQLIELYRHEPTNGPVDYFTGKGQSARKALMRTPINGARLSSGYGMRRHPILGYNKMHRGLDFAAPRGTPVVAAGDGTIERIGKNGAYGKYIRIRHNSTYKTAYAHLNGYARGMKTGKRVRQGQTIGYVGSTGRSTGPHLHYEVLRGNKQMNPLKLKLPTGQKLKGSELALFEQQVYKIRVLITEVESMRKVAKH